MSKTEKVRLNIGAGLTHIPNFINIDLSEKADISLDLGKDKLPFEDSSVDLIFSYHALEHIPDYLFALSEIHRVLRHGGRLLVGVPYVTLTEYNLVNPYHLHHFNEFSFDFFDEKKLRGSAAEETPICFKKVFHRFHYIGIFSALPPVLRDLCRRHLFNVVQKIDFGLIAIKSKKEKVLIPAESALIDQFDKCLDSRTRY